MYDDLRNMTCTEILNVRNQVYKILRKFYLIVDRYDRIVLSHLNARPYHSVQSVLHLGIASLNSIEIQ